MTPTRVTSIPDLTSAIKNLFLPNDDPESNLRYLVSIAGPTCSGKTTLANRLKHYFAGEVSERERATVAILHLDSYFRELHDPLLPRNAEKQPIFDLPESYRLESFKKHLHELLIGNSICAPMYDPVKCVTMVPQKLINSADIIIIEGLFCNSILGKIFYLPNLSFVKIYVETSKEVCHDRRVERDVEQYKITLDQSKKKFAAKILPYWKDLEKSERDDADIILALP